MPVGHSEQYGPRQHSGEIFVLSLPTGLPFLHSDAESKWIKSPIGREVTYPWDKAETNSLRQILNQPAVGI